MNSMKRRGAAAAAAGTALALTLGVLAAAGASADDDQTYTVTASATKVTIGDEIDVTVAANQVDDLYAYSVELGYDPALLQYVGNSADTEISGATYEKATAGAVEVTHTKLGTSPATTAEDVALVTATFTAIGSGSATIVASDLTSVTTDATSSTAPVVGAASLAIAKLAAPVATTAPSVTGKAVVGGVLTAGPGTWDVAGLQFAYQWVSAGAAVPGATGPSFKVPASAAGAPVSVRVTASKADHADGSAVATTGVVAKAATRTSLSASPRTLKPGKKLTTTVKVTAAGTVPTGTLTYKYRGKTVRQRVALVGGKAKVTFRPAKIGRNTIKVTFVPDAGYGASSASVKIRVKR